MDLKPGVFMSNASPADWVPDPDVPGTEMHEIVRADGVWAGMTRITSVDGPLDWTPDQRETLHVIEGSVRIELDDGSELNLGPGDTASIGAGTRTRWHVTTPFKELWVFTD